MKRYFLISLIFLIASFYSFADWKTDLSHYFHEKNYEKAVNYLKIKFESNSEITLPIFSGLLAFSYNKLNLKNEEYKWLSEYFENYQGDETIFSFLGKIPYREIESYLVLWKRKYPLIKEVSFIKEDSDKRLRNLPKLKIGINISNEAYYKFSNKERTIQVGLFVKGFNLLGLELLPLTEVTGLHSYFLDLKTDDLILKKEMRIDVQLDSEEAIKKKDNVSNNEFFLSMQIGNRLFVSEKENLEKFFSIDIKKLLEPHPTKYSKEIKEMFDPLPSKYRHYSQNTLNSNLGIFKVDLIEVYKFLKQHNEKSQKISGELKKISQIEITFKKNTEEGEKEVRAVISLKMKHLGTNCSR